jgi:hypothetical protein
MKRSGWAIVAAQLAVPVLLGLLIGGVLAFQAGSSNSVYRLPLGAVPTPSPSWVKPSAATTAVQPTPTPPAATAAHG